MDTIKANFRWDYNFIKEQLSNFSFLEIESGVMYFCLKKFGYENNMYDNEKSRCICEILIENNFPSDLVIIIEFFESMVGQENRDENGIVFTPKYIADYIVRNTICDMTKYDPSIKIMDPGCGGGVFLLSAVEYISEKFDQEVDFIIENNIFGMDIDSDNVRRCNLIMRLISAKNGGNYEMITTNIKCTDSLKTDWEEEFSVGAFNYIIGNPPYVNPHDMNKDTVKFLKSTYFTTQSGVFNIFYAFIEKAMKHISRNGVLGYIVPNNFLTIKSALGLREYLQSTQYVRSILDFSENMVFKPKRTYNCILVLSQRPSEAIEYYVMPKVEDIEMALKSIPFSKILTKDLDKNGWKLVDEVTRRNLDKIESKSTPIKEFIRTGIATLRDGVYLVARDEHGFYKNIDGINIYIEDELVKPIYKIPDLKTCDCIDDAKRYIIFPYVKTCEGYSLIDENVFAEKYPKTYTVLAQQRNELDARDKGKGAVQGWYAYGRTQGLNKYGKKLLFPTFAKIPRFTLVNNDDALFCNGYAVFENEKYDLSLLQKILNSCIMEYYVSNTSYSIEGGYYCYQKKYIEKFSLPEFTDEQIDFIKSADKEVLDNYLWELYHLE